MQKPIVVFTVNCTRVFILKDAWSSLAVAAKAPTSPVKTTTCPAVPIAASSSSKKEESEKESTASQLKASVCVTEAGLFLGSILFFFFFK